MKNIKIFSNIKYIYRCINEIDNGMFWSYIYCVPLDFLTVLLDMCIPSIFIYLLQNRSYTLFTICFVVASIGIIKIVLGYFENYVYSKQYIAEHKLVMFFLEKLNVKLMSINYERLEDPNFKLICEKAESSVANNHTEFIHFAENFTKGICSILKFLAFCIILTRLAWWIIVVLLVSAGVQYLLLLYIDDYEYKTKDSRIRVLRKLAYISYLSNEYKSAKDIRLYSLSGWLKEYFNDLNFEYHHVYKKLTRRKIITAFVDLLIIVLRDGGAYLYLGYLVLRGNISPAAFVLYFSVVSEFVGVLEEIVTSFEKMARGNYQANDYLDLIKIDDRRKGETILNVQEAKKIEMKNVYFRFPNSEEYTLKNINIEIKAGEKIAIVGLNGAGKSTLIKLMCGMYNPTSGKVLIDGMEADHVERKNYFSCFSTVFQEISVFPYSIAENIIYKTKDMKLLEKCCKEAGIYSKITSLQQQYDTKLIRNVCDDAIDLSGGEMQKLALARALYKGAGIILLDEPSASLDPIAEKKLYEKYNSFSENKTSVFISHRLASTRFCDRILLLENGSIVEEGSHQELMKREGKYAQLFLVQSQYYR